MQLAAAAARLLIHLVEAKRLVNVEALQQVRVRLRHLISAELYVLVGPQLDLARRARLQRSVELSHAQRVFDLNDNRNG